MSLFTKVALIDAFTIGILIGMAMELEARLFVKILAGGAVVIIALFVILIAWCI